jgi:hypothetical protein
MGAPEVFNELVKQTSISLAKLPPYRYMQPTDTPAAMIQWLLQQVPEPKPGEFPPLEDFDALRAAYDAWLSRNGS